MVNPGLSERSIMESVLYRGAYSNEDLILYLFIIVVDPYRIVSRVFLTCLTK